MVLTTIFSGDQKNQNIGHSIGGFHEEKKNEEKLCSKRLNASSSKRHESISKKSILSEKFISMRNILMGKEISFSISAIAGWGVPKTLKKIFTPKMVGLLSTISLAPFSPILNSDFFVFLMGFLKSNTIDGGIFSSKIFL